MKKTINNHFIQKAFAKNFSNKGVMKWTRSDLNCDESEIIENIFDIDEKDKSKHPIIEKKFHTQEIEDAMNEIESEGINLIRKLSYECNNNPERKITLTRRQVVIIKFYSLLSSVRTKKLRSNIENLNGDSLFKSIIQNNDRNSQEVQENWIKIIVDDYKKWKNNEPLKSLIELYKFDSKKTPTQNEIMYMNIGNRINSRLIFFVFKKNKLFLQEAVIFQEISKITWPRPIYDFMPICQNVGVMFYFDPTSIRMFNILKPEDSRFFNVKISMERHKVKYKNEKIILKELDKFMKEKINNKEVNQEEITRWNWEFNEFEKAKYHDVDDEFIYNIYEETEDVQDTCNAMSMVQNEGGVLLYGNKKDIIDARNKIKTLNIYRVEEKS